MRRQRIAIDQDNVIADLLLEWVRRYNYDYDDNLKAEQVNLWNWSSLTKPECGDKVYTYLDDPELFESLPVMQDSQMVTYELSKRYELFIVTAPFNLNNIIPKSNWLKRHFDFIPSKNYVFTRNKSIVNTDWLIDDKPDNFDGFEGYPLLFTSPHNLNENSLHRVNNWRIIGEWFEVI